MRLIKIGSDSHNDIVLRSNKVSGLHAEIIILNNGDILLEDKGSLNGTFVAGQKIKPDTAVTVHRGDDIRLADTSLDWIQVPMAESNSKYRKLYGIGSNFRNEIQVSGGTVSRFHATLKEDKQGRTFIEDHSMNGTTVNGKRIAAHQDIRLKPGDEVVVGGIPVDLKSYIRKKPMATVLKALACIAALALLGLGIWWLVGNTGKTKSKNPTLDALVQATPCVYGAYYIDVTINDDPFIGVINGWPEVWQFGVDRNGNLKLATMTNVEVDPIQFNGTAFFISPYGEMGTNRHIAVPWEYLSKASIGEINQQMQECVGNTGKLREALLDILSTNVRKKVLSYETAVAYLERFSKSGFNISGHFEYLGVILPGHNVSTISDLMSCQVIAESGDPKKDVALIRLNSQQTPEFIVTSGYYNIENARIDETQLKITEDQFRIIGYPGGMQIGFKTGNGEEINPSVHTATLSKVPDDNEFQLQTVGLGGQSGSPIIDSNRDLVGVFYSGLEGNEIAYGCNIKHLVELYNRYKVRK